MKYIIGDEEKPAETPIKLRLAGGEEGVFLVANNQYLLQIDRNGYIRRGQNIDERLGFKLTRRGEVRIKYERTR